MSRQASPQASSAFRITEEAHKGRAITARLTCPSVRRARRGRDASTRPQVLTLELPASAHVCNAGMLGHAHMPVFVCDGRHGSCLMLVVLLSTVHDLIATHSDTAAGLDRGEHPSCASHATPSGVVRLRNSMTVQPREAASFIAAGARISGQPRTLDRAIARSRMCILTGEGPRPAQTSTRSRLRARSQIGGDRSRDLRSGSAMVSGPDREADVRTPGVASCPEFNIGTEGV